ncbi:DUF3618 domain-containing protein [Pseudoroseomonas globiformis]|uniref:DUF3618 domain-containing protein n=1 Tax=Teichococcus globiformis TaxID=2307229 RepID=A0ABV7G0U6_9PROT
MSETTDPQGRSAAEIEADVERTRARVTETIEALRGSMSPGQVMDQVLDYARGSGGADFMRNLGSSVRDNPLPVLMIGSGIGWLLMAGQKNKEYAVHPRGGYAALPPPRPAPGGPGLADRASSAAQGIGAVASDAASSVGDTARSAATSIKDAAASLAGSASDTASAARGRMSSAAGTARAYHHDASDAAAAAMDAARHRVNRAGSQAHDGWARMSAEQPLLLGALGLAAGAALAALLPRTETEDRLMGEASDALKGQVGEIASEQYATVKETVAPHVQEAREAIKGAPQAAQQKMDEDGVSAASGRDVVTGVAGRLAETAKSAAHDVADQSKTSLGRLDQDQRPSS